MRSRAIRILPAAVVLLAAVATAAVPAHAQKKQTASMADLCTRATEVQREFQLVNNQVIADLQTINKLGFRRNVEEFERAANLPAALVWDGGVAGIRKLLFDKTLEKARAELLRQAASGAVDFGLTGASEALRATAQQGAPTTRSVELLRRLAASSHPSSQTARDVLQAQNIRGWLEVVDQARTAYGVASPAVQQEMMETAAALAHEVALMGVARLGTVSLPSIRLARTPVSQAGWAGVVLSLNEWAWLQAYKSAETVNTVRVLTESTVEELETLRDAARRLKVNVPRLKVLRGELPTLARSCDRTRLVKKGGGGATGWVVGTLLAGGAVVGGAAYAEQQRLKEEGGGNGGGSSNSYCLSTRNCIVNSNGSCSCSSGGEACGYSSPGSGVGGSCPCRSGLSCNNGRCESRSGGRCP